MNESAKQKRLTKISQESNLRELLVKLFERMGSNPILTHGGLELGKDIVCKETNMAGATEWVGCVVKVGKISGATSGNASLQTIANQAQEVFAHPYADTVTKQKHPINKVFIITNDVIIETAREKLIEKVSSFGYTGANIHFFDAARLVGLLDEHWPEFWETQYEGLALDDPMTSEVGKTLYVVALANTKHARPTKRKSDCLSKTAIVNQTGLPLESVEGALSYLISSEYLDRQSDDTYALGRKLTAGRLLTKTSHINLLFLLDKKANSTRHISAREAVKTAKKKLGYTQSFVKQALLLFLKGGYFEIDISRGKNHYRVNDGMLQDEDAYLRCWLKFHGKVPPSNAK
jgi:hypothetical protein